MINIILVSVGGFLGAIARFYISKKWNGHFNSRFPYGTLMVNLAGAFLLGVVVGAKVTGYWYSLIGVGFMGAFTTFSTLKLELEQLRKEGINLVFNRYILCSYCFGLLLAFCGILIGKSI